MFRACARLLESEASMAMRGLLRRGVELTAAGTVPDFHRIPFSNRMQS